MKLVKVDDHLNNVIQKRKCELVVKDTDSARVLRLFDSQCSEFSQVKGVSPPVSFVGRSIRPFLVSSCELWLVFDVGDSGQEGVMHDKEKFFFGVDDVKFDKISALIKCGLESLECIFW